MRIYLDHAASTPLRKEVLEAMTPFLCDYFGNGSSAHHHGRKLKSAIENARATVAEYVGAAPSEIFFTSGGTEADNMAIVGAVRAYKLTHIISTEIEHHAVTHTIEHLEKEGTIRKTYLPVDERGNIQLHDLETALANNPRSLVSLMHGNNEIGTLHDIRAIGELCEKYNALFHSDTVQTIGTFKYDLSDLKVHFITASAHKFNGPKGVGFLYIKQGTRIPALILGGSQERNMRAGTENVASIVGLAKAFELCQCGQAEKRKKLWGLKSYMMEQLKAKMPDVAFNGEIELDKAMPNVLNVAVPCGPDDAMLLFNMDIAGVSVSGGSACTSGSVQGSHVLSCLGHRPERVINSIRFSFGYGTSKEEIDFAINSLINVVQSQIFI